MSKGVTPFMKRKGKGGKKKEKRGRREGAGRDVHGKKGMKVMSI